MKYEKGTEEEVTLLCHVTQHRTGARSPFLAEGQRKPQTSDILRSVIMLSSNNDEKNHKWLKATRKMGLQPVSAPHVP